MSSSLDIHTELSRPYASATNYLDEPLYALMDLIPFAGPDAAERAPLNIVIVVDSSATMHHFQLTPEEYDYWIGLAVSRDEVERGEADEREAVYWTGQTLAEMQSIARNPMALAVEAIKNLLATLQPADKVAVIAFADRVHTIFTEQDWAAFPDNCYAQLDRLREQRLPFDIGTGTFMAESLGLAGEYLAQNAASHGINRLIVISDGIVQDTDATLSSIQAIQERGFAITTIGVGEEFDEEFLIHVADNSRGEYHYAADIAEITAALQQEMTTLQTTSVTELYIAVRGLEGTVVQDVYLARPSMSLFDEVYREEDWTRARIGDVSGSAPVSVLIQLALPTLREGTHDVLEAQLTWASAGGTDEEPQRTEKTLVPLEFTNDAALLTLVNDNVTDIVERFSVYKYEREAQRAQERGDFDRAREKLGAATRALTNLGEPELAHEMEAQIISLEAGINDPSRAKRVKATTRRLGAGAGVGTRRLEGGAVPESQPEPDLTL